MSQHFLKVQLLLSAVIIVLANIAYGQTIPEEYQNISSDQIASIKVDELSDEQIQLFMQKFEETGMSEDELRSALELKGMSQSEISKLFTRMQSIQLTGGSSSSSSNSRIRTEPASSNPISSNYEGDLISGTNTQNSTQEVSELNKRIFGYKLFNSQYLTFETPLNIPTPKNYQLGPQDEVIIDVWGASEITYQETISPDGYVVLANIGPIYLSGLTIEEAQKRIFSKLSQIYSGLRGPNPNTYVQTSLGQVRTINVSVIGEVIKPGTYSVSSLSTAFNALYLSGGPNENGTFREIEVIRNNEVYRTIDVYDFLVEGTQKNNVTLQEMDIIRIKPYRKRIEVIGEVKREGLYECIDGDTFEDLIRYAGGFTENAYSAMIKVRRNNGSEKSFLDLTEEEQKTFNPENGDKVIIESILNRFDNRVMIKGAVFRQGEYELSKDLTVKGLIEKAQGLKGDAFLERGVIVRTNPDFSTSVIPFNIREMMKGQEEDITLKREDVVRISSIYDLREEYYVTINGEVNKPGTFPYHHNMTIEDIVLLANGLRESATNSRVEIARRYAGSDETSSDVTAEIFNFTIDRNLEFNDNGDQFILKPFDQIFIRRAPNYQRQINVKLEGEVKYPGYYVLKQKNERISDLINRSGGLTDEGYPLGATLIRRTEFNPPQTDSEQNKEKLSELRKRNGQEIDPMNAAIASLPEAAYLQQKRLNNLDQNSSINGDEGAELGVERINARKRQLEQLTQREGTAFDNENMQYETIGIDLEEIMKNPGSKYDLIMEEGDILSVPKRLQTVKMRGEFLYPVAARFDKGLDFRDYVSLAGGFTVDAKKSKSYVVYANGDVDRTKKIIFFNHFPKIEPGAEIIVPKKSEKNSMSLAELVTISSALATLALAINTIAN